MVAWSLPCNALSLSKDVFEGYHSIWDSVFACNENRLDTCRCWDTGGFSDRSLADREETGQMPSIQLPAGDLGSEKNGVRSRSSTTWY